MSSDDAQADSVHFVTAESVAAESVAADSVTANSVTVESEKSAIFQVVKAPSQGECNSNLFF